MSRLPAAPWLALALLVVGARAVTPPPFTAADLGTGTAEPANCTLSADAGGAGGDMESSWLEITGGERGAWGLDHALRADASKGGVGACAPWMHID